MDFKKRISQISVNYRIQDGGAKTVSANLLWEDQFSQFYRVHPNFSTKKLVLLLFHSYKLE